MKVINLFIIFLMFVLKSTTIFANDNEFSTWLKSFEKYALSQGISKVTFNKVMSDAKFLPKVIEYDRYQPEFYEDTKTYIEKRTSDKKVKNGKKIFEKNKKLINFVDSKFSVEKELLLSLMAVETNFGTYLGKMNIVSSLATLSFDKRRSEFFTNELITVLKLIDSKVINIENYYGSWAGAFGNFQFMPTTIMNYAIDFDKDKKINLKSIDDSFASAANYLNQIGWKKNQPCYMKINLKNNTPKFLLNTSAKKINNKNEFKYFKKYIIDAENIAVSDNLKVAIVTPDTDIKADARILEPAFIVFDNYEIILKWNRSLRFALAVCNLKNKFKNEL